MIVEKVFWIKQGIFQLSQDSKIKVWVVKFADDLVFVFVENFWVIDLLEMVKVCFGFVGNAVVYETGSGLEIFDNWWWNVFHAVFVVIVFLLSLDEKILELIRFDAGIHVSCIWLVN